MIYHVYQDDRHIASFAERYHAQLFLDWGDFFGDKAWRIEVKQ